MPKTKDPLVLTLESDEEIAVKEESKTFAVPLDSLGELLACRVCLSTDVKLYNLHGCKLADSFGEFTGTPVSPQDGFPQHLCCMCRALLIKAAAFRDRCRNTQCSLQNIRAWTPQLTTQDVRLIDKTDFKLPLIQTLPLTLDYFDITHVNNRQTEFVDIKNEATTRPPILPSEFIDIESSGSELSDKNIEAKGIETIELLDEILIKDIKPDNASNVGLYTGSDSYNYEMTLEETDDHSDDMDVKSIKCEKVRTSKRTKTIKRTRRSAPFLQDEEDYKNFSTKYNVEIIHLSVQELMDELSVMRESDSFKESDNKCELCCKVFKDKIKCKKHSQRHHTSKGRFECEICRLRFVKNSLRLEHEMKVHNNLRYRCKLCRHTSRQAVAAIKHFETHADDDKTTFECKDCDKTFSRRRDYNEHVKQNHSPRRCQQCGKTFAEHRALRRHIVVHHQAHKCSSCKASFKNSDALDKHQCGKSSCAICGEGFESEDQLKAHKYEAHIAKTCVECGFSCSSEQKLSSHWAREHKGQPRPDKKRRVRKKYKAMCEICSMFVANRKLHMLKHSKERPYQCKFCEKRFKLKYHFQVHLNKQYQCLKCKLCFVSQVNLEKHRMKPCLSKPYQCDMCKRRFTHKSALETHIANHDTIIVKKPSKNSGNHEKKKMEEEEEEEIKMKKQKGINKCKVCGQTFSSYWLVSKHKAEVHGSEKKYQCDVCGKVYWYKPFFINHLKSHTGERPFKCSLCPKAYGLMAVLTEHMNMHTGAKPYKCSLCPETFSRHWMRYEHRMRVHLQRPVKKRSRAANTSYDVSV